MNAKSPLSAIALGEKVLALPVSHGKAAFALAVRRLFWETRFDCVLIAWPAVLREDCLEGVTRLPVIDALAIHLGGKCRAYLPLDPCDGYIEGIRQAQQRRLPLGFSEDETLLHHRQHFVLPDCHLIHSLGIEGYFNLARPYFSSSSLSAEVLHRAKQNEAVLEKARKEYQRILFLCDFPLLEALQRSDSSASTMGTSARASGPSEAPESPSSWEEPGEVGIPEGPVSVDRHPVKPGLLYFALGELPYYAGEVEKERQNPLAPPTDYLELVKRIFRETRLNYLDKQGQVESINLNKLQVCLTYLRNLAAHEHRLTPDLMEIITAAKGVFGSGFATKVLEAARYYPFFDPVPDASYLEPGLQGIKLPGQDDIVSAVNLLLDEPKVWKTIHLKKEPERKRQQLYRYLWDPRGMCSHTPEDDRIEAFNRAVRGKAKDFLELSHARTEKLTASVKDGIDIRDTVRNWHSGHIYVREIPPTRGRVDTVVILFDQDHDDRYPQRTTWYAEHPQESTLTFYATNPLEKMIGPGLAESLYGGLSLLFPPRPVPDVFHLTKASDFQNLAEQLLFGALNHTRERSVAFVALRRPGVRMRRMASQMKKNLVWVPLHSFSSETLRRLRRFHILNGKHVRSWASRFIPED